MKRKREKSIYSAQEYLTSKTKVPMQNILICQKLSVYMCIYVYIRLILGWDCSVRHRYIDWSCEGKCRYGEKTIVITKINSILAIDQHVAIRGVKYGLAFCFCCLHVIWNPAIVTIYSTCAASWLSVLTPSLWICANDYFAQCLLVEGLCS